MVSDVYTLSFPFMLKHNLRDYYDHQTSQIFDYAHKYIFKGCLWSFLYTNILKKYKGAFFTHYFTKNKLKLEIWFIGLERSM